VAKLSAKEQKNDEVKRKRKAVWCVPFSSTVGLFNKLQTQKKEKRKRMLV